MFVAIVHRSTAPEGCGWLQQTPATNPKPITPRMAKRLMRPTTLVLRFKQFGVKHRVQPGVLVSGVGQKVDDLLIPNRWHHAWREFAFPSDAAAWTEVEAAVA